MARTRRPAAEARAHILSVARPLVLAHGPAALRLKDVAEAAGVSHPTVLHHFGNREGLVSAVVSDALTGMDDELERILADSTELDPGPVVLAVSKVMSDGGYGRLVAWLALSSESGEVPGGRVASVVQAVHATRVRLLPEGAAAPSYEDSEFLSVLVTCAVVGEAVIGRGLRRNLASADAGAGPDEAGQGGRAEFQSRLVALVRRWLGQGSISD
ncbi:MAG: TetR/AcrR family transcriptional regulator [Myxococcota bacterium]